MTTLHIASFKRRRAITHLEAAREALDLYLRAMDDADEMAPQRPAHMQAAQDYTDDLKKDISEMLRELQREQERAA